MKASVTRQLKGQCHRTSAVQRNSGFPELVEGTFCILSPNEGKGFDKLGQAGGGAWASVVPVAQNSYLTRMSSPELDALTQALARLPGLGPRSARRAVLHLIKRRETALRPLLGALEAVAHRLSVCGICGNVDTRDPCGVCADPRRDAKLLCVVEEVSDLWALDRSRLFPGRFHVLGGRLSALEGVRPEDLAIDSLIARVAAGGIDEVVLAMNATLESQTTAH